MNLTRNRILVSAVAVCAAFYFTWRIGAFNPAAPVFSWIVLIAEVIGFVRALMFLLANVRPARVRPVLAPERGLTVDIAVPTCGEPIDLLRRTLEAALDIRYPHATWVLDDAARGDVRDLARELGCRYVTRSTSEHGKAGNLNHALPLMEGEYLAVLDADEIASPFFLHHTLGYFNDSLTAFVQTPHEVLNTDSFEHPRRGRVMGHAQASFNHLVQRSRDSADASLYCGSAAVLRRAAIDEVGGFATGTVSEDTHTSMRLNEAGWHGVFHPHVLTAGIAPYDAAAYYGQRMRFAHGAIQLVRAGALRGRKMTRAQAQAYRLHVLANIEGWRYLFIYALPIVILISGVLPVSTNGLAFLLHVVPYAAVVWLATNALARGHAYVFETAMYDLARVPASVRATFTGFRTDRSFRITPKVRSTRGYPAEGVFPWLVAAASLGAIVYAAVRAIAGISALPADALLLVSAWAALHVSTAVQLIMHTRRCDANRRVASRVACSLPATIVRRDEPGRRHAITLREATADGCTFAWDATAVAIPPPGLYDTELSVEGQTFGFALEVRGGTGDGRSGGAMIWIDPAERGAFDLMLARLALARVVRLVDTDIPDRVEIAL